VRGTDSKEDGQIGESDLNKFRESMYFFLLRTCEVLGAFCGSGCDWMLAFCRYRISECW